MWAPTQHHGATRRRALIDQHVPTAMLMVREMPAMACRRRRTPRTSSACNDRPGQPPVRTRACRPQSNPARGPGRRPAPQRRRSGAALRPPASGLQGSLPLSWPSRCWTQPRCASFSQKKSRASSQRDCGGSAGHDGPVGTRNGRACFLVGADRKLIRYDPVGRRTQSCAAACVSWPMSAARFGCRRLFILLRREGQTLGINRIHRLYREEGLSVRERRARCKAAGTLASILVEAKANARCSLDFVQDQFANGQSSASSTSSTTSPRCVWARSPTPRSQDVASFTISPPSSATWRSGDARQRQ